MEGSSSWGPRVWGTRLCKVMGGGMERIWGGIRRLWELGVILRLLKGTHSQGRGLGSQTVEAQHGGTWASLRGLARSPRDGDGGADHCGVWEVPGPAGMRGAGAGGPAEGEGEGRPPALHSRPAPPAASEQTFLSLQVEAGAAGGGGCTAPQAACAAERGARIPDPAARGSSGPGPGPSPSLSPLRAEGMARGGGRGRR